MREHALFLSLKNISPPTRLFKIHFIIRVDKKLGFAFDARARIISYRSE